MRKRKRSKKWLLLAIPVLFLAAPPAYYYLTVGPIAAQLPQEIAEARAAGIPLTPDDLKEALKVDPAENAAPYFEAAAARYVNWTQARMPRPPAVSIDLAKEMTAEKLVELRSTLKELEPSFAAIHAGLQRPRYQPERQFELGHMLMFPELGRLRALAQSLATRAYFKAADGDWRGAHEGYLAALGVAERIGQEPFLICYIVANSLESYTLQLCLQSVNENGDRPDALALLAELLGKTWKGDPIRARLHETPLTLAAIDDLKSWEDLRSLQGEQGQAWWARHSIGLDTMKEAMKARFIQIMRTLKTVAKQQEGSPEAVNQVMARVDGDDQSLPMKLLRSIQYTDLIIERGPKFVAVQRLARLAVALDEHRKKTGSYPASLPQLGPDSTDPYTSKPFDYRLQGGHVAVLAHDMNRPRGPASSGRIAFSSDPKLDLAALAATTVR